MVITKTIIKQEMKTTDAMKQTAQMRINTTIIKKVDENDRAKEI